MFKDRPLLGYALLSAALICVAVMAVAFAPTITPRRTSPLIFLPIVLLLAGTYAAAGHLRWLPAYFIYGCLASLPFSALFMPDGRAYLGGGGDPPWLTTTMIGMVIVASGLVCRWLAAERISSDQARRWADKSRCANCGYLLLGLLERRCPECGAPF